MTLRQLALKRTVIFCLSALAIGLANGLAIEYIGVQWVGGFWLMVFLIYGVRFVYQTEVDRLERENTLKRIKDSQ